MAAHPVITTDQFEKVVPIDLSSDVLGPFNNQSEMEGSLLEVLGKNRDASGENTLFYGGYLEKRSLYQASQHFSLGVNRNIHLGIDIWASPETEVLAAFHGTIHSWKFNSAHLDYGYCLIVQYSEYYVLYGHLAAPTHLDWTPGKPVLAGELIARIGDKDVNGGWVPHLHLQIIRDIGDFKGDFPGVCSEADLAYYAQNCPNPNHLLGLQ